MEDDALILRIQRTYTSLVQLRICAVSSSHSEWHVLAAFAAAEHWPLAFVALLAAMFMKNIKSYSKTQVSQ